VTLVGAAERRRQSNLPTRACLNGSPVGVRTGGITIMEDDDRDHENQMLLANVMRVAAACAGLPFRDRLDALQLAWLFIARTAREEAQAARPGGFAVEQARQVKHLTRIADMVRDDVLVPDPELERLDRAGDYEGIVNRLRQLLSGRGTH
jgi:hypothetical protein